MMLLAIVLATVLRSISSDIEYLDQFFSIPESMQSSSGMAAIPGSSETYANVRYYDGRTWTVYTNDVMVITNEEVSLVHETRYGGDYDLAYDISDTFSTLGLQFDNAWDRYVAWHPSMFDFICQSKLRSSAAAVTRVPTKVTFVSNHDGTLTDIQSLTDTPCYHPIGYRFTNRTLAALLSSYAAYFERLYYASEGYVKDYDEKWGPKNACNGFLFNITNDEYEAGCYFDFADFTPTNGASRTIRDTRKIADCLDLKKLQRTVIRDMLLDEVTIDYATKPVNASFIFRPHGILDISDTGDPCNSYVWWASQDDPPVFYYEHENDMCVQDPETDGFGFFPTFNWTDQPIASHNGTEVTQKFDWPTRCVTLSMATAGNPMHPAAKLFENIGLVSTDIDNFVIPYHFDSDLFYPLLNWMTNIHYEAGCLYTDRESAFDGYVTQAAAAAYRGAPLRRILPNDYVGVNHVLSAMNRTIHIPSFSVFTTNEQTCVSRSADYTLDLPLTYNIYENGTVEIAGQKSGTSYVPKTSSTDEVSTVEYEYGDGFYLYASEPTVMKSVSTISGTTHGQLKLNLSALEEIGHEGSNEVEIISLAASADNRHVFVSYNLDGTNGYTSVGGTIVGAEGTASVGFSLDRSYSYDETKNATVHLGPTQPGATGSGLVDEGTAVALYRFELDINSQDPENVDSTNITLYASRNAASFSNRAGLEASLNNRMTSTPVDFKSAVTARNGGFDWHNMNSYAPMANGYTVSWEMDDEQIVSFYVDPADADFTKLFHAPIYYTFVNATNVHWWTILTIERLNYDEIRQMTKTVTVYTGSGTVTSSVTDNGTVTGLRGVEYIGPSSNDTVMVEYGTYRAGPFDSEPATVSVPDYKRNVYTEYTMTVEHFDYYDDISIVTNMMTGTGPDDPGDLNEVLYGYESTIVSNAEIEGASPAPTIEETPPEVDVYNERLPSEGTMEGGSAFWAHGTLFFTFTITNGTIDEESVRAFVRYRHPTTGEIVGEEEKPFPYTLGDFYCDLVIEFDCSTPEVEGCKASAEATGNSKIITQVDWAWHNLKKN